jgi:hypothetical protein
MKNFIRMFALALCFMAIFSFKASAQCPTGWTLVTPPVMIINGCPYQIEVCVYCSLVGNVAETQIRSITALSSGCTQTWNFQQVYNYVNAQIQTASFYNAYLCTGGIPPCDPPTTTVRRTYNEPICWYVTKVMYFGNEHHVYRPCDDSPKCIRTVDICVNGSTVVETLVSGPTLTSGTLCFDQASEITIPDNFDEPSGCYELHTACNP